MSLEKRLALVTDRERQELYADQKYRMEDGFLSAILLGHEILRRHPRWGLKDAYNIAVEMRRIENQKNKKTGKHA